ncbi:MAG: hypothetical protein OHK0011_09590 [Turneriella sp.]
MTLRFLFLLSSLALACSGKGVSLHDLETYLNRPEYTPSGDGWAEARRRRLVTRYLGQSGFQVRAVQRPYADGRAGTKYRQVDLLAESGQAAGSSTRMKVTLALVLPQKFRDADDLMTRQKQCDRILLSFLRKAAEYRQMELVTAPVCFGLTAQRGAQE